MGAGGGGQGCEWSTVRAKRRWDAANDCSTVAAARTQETTCRGWKHARGRKKTVLSSRVKQDVCARGIVFWGGAEECG
jgi:hypothetical protein